jgi:hypothetical protein
VNEPGFYEAEVVGKVDERVGVRRAAQDKHAHREPGGVCGQRGPGTGVPGEPAEPHPHGAGVEVALGNGGHDGDGVRPDVGWAGAVGAAVGAGVERAAITSAGAPAPRVLVFATLIVLFSALLVALADVPETVTRRPGSLRSLRPRASVPAQARSTFRAMAPVLIATWAVGGLVLSLGPSLAAGVFGARNHLVGGLVVSAVAGFGAAGSVLTRSWTSRPTMLHGALVLVAGVGLVLGALGTGWTALVLRRPRRHGLGLGTAFVGSFGAVAGIATRQQRAELFASLYVVSYLAFGGSAVLAGLAVPCYGLRPTATVYGAIVIALSLAAAAAGLSERSERRQRRQRRITLPNEP